MKIYILVFSILSLYACKNDLIEDADPLIGEWQLIEQNISTGGSSSWQTVEDGEKFLLESDGSYNGFTLFPHCADGIYEVTIDELVLTGSCTTDIDSFTYALSREKNTIVLVPKTVLCFETCAYRFKRN